MWFLKLFSFSSSNYCTYRAQYHITYTKAKNRLRNNPFFFTWTICIFSLLISCQETFELRSGIARRSGLIIFLLALHCPRRRLSIALLLTITPCRCTLTPCITSPFLQSVTFYLEECWRENLEAVSFYQDNVYLGPSKSSYLSECLFILKCLVYFAITCRQCVGLSVSVCFPEATRHPCTQQRGSGLRILLLFFM